MAYASSSSSFEPKSGRKYDVFISFRGEDTRHNFTSHLYTALKRASLEVFLDDKKLQKGDEIAPSLIQAIRDSSISLIVFSQDYASSKWCLDELVNIMRYRKEEGQFVLPIFYKVDPSDVRGQKGDYGKAFEKHELDFKDDPNKVNGWRSALFEAANLCGDHCIQSVTDENNLIEKIIADVKTKLEHIYKSQYAFEDLIGIDEIIEPVEELLQKFDKVGIWGMGGAGKTTMAKVVFAKLSYQYDTSCFLENVREQTEKNNGLESVCKSLVSKLLGQDVQSNALLSRMLGNKKALVVLDDVDSFKQLEELHDKICDRLKKGSKVIIATRDQQLLRARGYEIHEVKGLNYDNSRHLFMYNAFRSGHLEDGYEALIEGFVDYTKHNPLALKVLGSLVCSEPKEAWDGLLKKLNAGNPNHEIQNALRLSYDVLDHKDKQVFLDIACFFKGESKEFLEELLESFEFYPTCGMQKLKNRALISETTDGNVEMHDLIQEMGHQIVREENFEEPGKRSRLWDPNETIDVLKNCEGKKVEGILCIYGDEQLDLTAETFKNMKNLRFLKIISQFHGRGNIKFPTSDLEFISSKIRYFHWENYPGKSLPSNFCAKLLLELNLEDSEVETLWDGVQDLANLRRIKLTGCEKLRELPDFSKACKLESIDVSFCTSLHEVSESVLRLPSLISLNVKYCTSLESLQSGIHLKSLKQIDASWCLKLKEFSLSSEELTSLNLVGTEIEELRPSMGRCSKLKTLKLPPVLKFPKEALKNLRSLEKLVTFSRTGEKNDGDGLSKLVDHLQGLQYLGIHGFWGLKELPDNITQLSGLEELHLDASESLTKLPDNMRHLSRLQFLSLQGCHNLKRLPELPPSLRVLEANNCYSLERASISSIGENCGGKGFSLLEYNKFGVGSIDEEAMRMLQNAFQGKQEEATIIYPREMFPEWFEDNRTQHEHSFDTFQLSLSTSHNLLGFVFCVVISKSICRQLHLSVTDEGDEMIHDAVFPFHTMIDPGNVCLFCRPELSKSIMEEMEGIRRNHGATTYNPILSFQFNEYPFLDEPPRECGVYPIYASQSSDFKVYSRKGKAIQ